MSPLRKPIRSTLVIWSLIVVMFFLIVFSIFARRKEPEAAPVQEKAYPVEILTLTAESMTDELLLPGRIEPFMRALLPTDKPGRVIAIAADRGDVVTNGQVLLTLDARLWQSMLDAASLELREAQKELARWNDLEAAGAVSSSDMDQIRTRVDRAIIQHREAATHVAQCSVISPTNGIINDRFVEVGEYATEGMATFELIVADPVTITLDIPERDAGPFRAHTHVDFSVGVLPGQRFTGEVTFAATASQNGNNTFRMEVQVDNNDLRLKPGMIAELRYTRGQLDHAIAVPLDAIIPLRGEHVVFIDQDARAVRRLVKIDRLMGSRALITEGLSAGDRLIVRGNRGLVDGVLLRDVGVPEPEVNP
jgi:RND family efflux transporter MFP subunit